MDALSKKNSLKCQIFQLSKFFRMTQLHGWISILWLSAPEALAVNILNAPHINQLTKPEKHRLMQTTNNNNNNNSKNPYVTVFPWSDPVLRFPACSHTKHKHICIQRCGHNTWPTWLIIHMKTVKKTASLPSHTCPSSLCYGVWDWAKCWY